MRFALNRVSRRQALNHPHGLFLLDCDVSVLETIFRHNPALDHQPLATKFGT